MRAFALASTCLVCGIYGRRMQAAPITSLREQQDGATIVRVPPSRADEAMHELREALASLLLVARRGAPTRRLGGRAASSNIKRWLDRIRPASQVSMTGTSAARQITNDISIPISPADLSMRFDAEQQENEEDNDLPFSMVEDIESIIADLGAEPLSYKSRQMFYLPSEQLPALTERVGEDSIDIVERILKLDPDLTGDVASYFAVVKALLLFGAGALDEAHNLVLPMCWYDFTDMGGPPIRNAAASQEAAYVNALLHRQEGDFLGQWGDGQVGWDNALFWFKQAGDHSVYSDLPASAQDFLNGRWKAPASKALNTHMAEHEDSWSAESFVSLTREAVESDDQEALEFCSHMINLEWRSLLAHCWEKVKPHL